MNIALHPPSVHKIQSAPTLSRDGQSVFSRRPTRSRGMSVPHGTIDHERVHPYFRLSLFLSLSFPPRVESPETFPLADVVFANLGDKVLLETREGCHVLVGNILLL